MIKTYKITFKLIRSFGLGFQIYSPKLNGLCFDITLGCFVIAFWNRGKELVGFQSYWDISDWIR